MRLALVLAAILLASPSSAQVQCTSGDIGAALLEGYGERLLFQGVTMGCVLLELYVSRDRGTWTTRSAGRRDELHSVFGRALGAWRPQRP